MKHKHSKSQKLTRWLYSAVIATLVFWCVIALTISAWVYRETQNTLNSGVESKDSAGMPEAGNATPSKSSVEVNAPPVGSSKMEITGDWLTPLSGHSAPPVQFTLPQASNPTERHAKKATGSGKKKPSYNFGHALPTWEEEYSYETRSQ